MFIGYTEGALEARERFGVVIRFTPDLYRSMTDLELAEECARQCVRYADRGIVGIGVGGVVEALDEGVRAVADADDGDADLVVAGAAVAVSVRVGPVG